MKEEVNATETAAIPETEVEVKAEINDASLATSNVEDQGMQFDEIFVYTYKNKLKYFFFKVPPRL